jgi:protease-4
MGRWVNADEIAKVLFGNDINITTTSLDEMNTNPFQPKKPQPIDNKWGIPLNKIAIVYAKGVCAMDFGINARKLVEDLKDAMEDESIQAVVLRVDSPGGDAMASDYIADVLRKFKNKKPIIVSQGWVAASGGYWLSMDADAIVSSPMTITGSIGVIGSFLYDKGLKDSIGITTDIVKIGKYADLGYPFVLPFIPIGLPVRNLTEDERSKIESRIMQMYKDFVGKVAKGRNKKYEEIEQIAQGRIWSGIEGKKIGIVDEIGGLEKAIMLAKEKANIPFDEDCIIEEYPALGWFDFSSLLNLLFGIRVETENELLNTFKILLKNNTTPMPILPIDYWGEEVMVH